MEAHLKIGDRVITNKFEERWPSKLAKYINKEGVISSYSEDGDFKVHGYWWPALALTLVPANTVTSKIRFCENCEAIIHFSEYFCDDTCRKIWERNQPVPSPQSNPVEQSNYSSEDSLDAKDFLIKENVEETTEMNIHERRDFEKTKSHICNNCKKEFTGWTSDYKTDNTIRCRCPHCNTWNYYKYWGETYPAGQLLPADIPIFKTVGEESKQEKELHELGQVINNISDAFIKKEAERAFEAAREIHGLNGMWIYPDFKSYFESLQNKKL